MRKCIWVLLILVASIGYGQVHKPPQFGNVKFSISQDFKFMTTGDTKRGYSPGTRDLIYRLKLEDENYLTLGIKGVLILEYEVADIQYGFERWSVGTGVAFDNVLSGKWLGVPDMWWRHTITGQYGWIVRGGNFTTGTGLITLEHSTRLTEGFALIASHQYMQRSDLGLFFEDYGVWRYSFFVGIEIDFQHIYYTIGKLWN